MTVRELINHLAQFDLDLPVGRSGYFGEFHPMNKHDFYPGKARKKLKWNEPKPLERNQEFDILDITPPDIRDEPY